MLNKLFKSLYYRLKNYNDEIMNFNFNDFNKFIITVLLKQLTRTDVILPVAIGFITVLISFQSLTQSNVFFPQSNVPAYVTFVLFQCAMSIAIVYVLPLITIIILNAIFSIIQKYWTKGVLLIKLLITVVIYHYAFTFLNNKHLYHTKDQIGIIILWVMLYFICMNLYISHTKHRSLIKFTKLKALFFIAFIWLSIKPITLILVNTSKSTDFLRINTDMLLTPTNCYEMMKSNPDIKPENYIANNPEYFESKAQGCIVHKNNVRTGFASDYVIVIRKNIIPVKESDNHIYNFYSRIACYSSNCFIDNQVKKDITDDEWIEMIPFPKSYYK
ncbi:MAG: hypothetical protein EKK64_08030 [Neisseriaceae bacterium]|nr:MAG: hypothetical protein EKK64_08030 [Neisseriaceae bacterium]